MYSTMTRRISSDKALLVQPFSSLEYKVKPLVSLELMIAHVAVMALTTEVIAISVGLPKRRKMSKWHAFDRPDDKEVLERRANELRKH